MDTPDNTDEAIPSLFNVQRLERARTDVDALIVPPIEGEPLEVHHINWFLDQIASGAPPHNLAKQLGRPMAEIRKRLTALGEELEQDLTLALRIQTLQRAANAAAIADGPANPNYKGDGDVKRDKLRLSHNQDQLAILTKLAPTQRHEVNVNISIADNLAKAKRRLIEGQDVSDAVIIEPAALPMRTTEPAHTVESEPVENVDYLSGL